MDRRCAAALCGRYTPALAHAAIVSPEQSNEFGPAAPHTYGLPIWAHAYFTAVPALPDGYVTGHGAGRSEVRPMVWSYTLRRSFCSRANSAWVSFAFSASSASVLLSCMPR